MNFFEKVYEIVNTVPRGCVMSYGQVAALAGSPRMARQVGWALHVCPDQVPWHRIIRKGRQPAGAFFPRNRKPAENPSGRRRGGF